MKDIGAIDHDNPAAVWAAIDRLVDPARHRATLAKWFKSRDFVLDITNAVKIAPVIEFDGRFSLDCSTKPRKSAWRWVVTAREMDHSRPGQMFLYARAAAGTIETTASLEALCGNAIVDLVACTQDFLRVSSRLLGQTAVVGCPLHPDQVMDPIPVYETPLAWLLARGNGVFLCGDDWEQGTWLRECFNGIRTSTPSLGVALQKKMRRRVELPPVLVDA